MATGLDLQNVLNGLNIDGVITEVLTKKSNALADYNAYQLSEGLRSDGSQITPGYAPLTVMLKQTKSGLAGVTDHVTLYDTGSFYEEMYSQVKGDEIEYGSKDSKADRLQARYDKSSKNGTGSIFGLTDKSREMITETETGPLWKQLIEDKTGLTFS
jgi:hypothetical protein